MGTFLLLVVLQFPGSTNTTTVQAAYDDAPACQNAAREVQLQALQQHMNVLVHMCSAK
jgi:hypothetical protein